MSVISLNRNNKNQYRKYPLKQGSSLIASDGYVLSDSAITACSITSIYGKHKLYIKQIFYKKNIIRIVLASFFDDEALGVFSGSPGDEFTTLQLTPFSRYISGNLTIAPYNIWATIPTLLNFDKSATELEESTIFCYQHPAVTSIKDRKENELRGNVNFGVLTNVDKITGTKNTSLYVTNPESVNNLADMSSFLGNCPTPVIENINGVIPTPANFGNPINDNNIYVAGVKPVVFFGEPGENGNPAPGSVGVETSGINLNKLCTERHKLLPPVDVTGFTLDSMDFKNMYYSKPAMPADPIGTENYPLPKPERLASNFNATLRPEYYYWPQFVKAEYYNFWNIPKT